MFFKHNTEAIVIKAFNNKLYASVNDRVFILEEMLNHECKSKNFDMDYKKPKTKKKYIPPMSHPWKKYEFKKFINYQLQNNNSEIVLSA